MKKKQVMVMTVLLFAAMFAALVFSQAHFSVLSIYENGIDRGDELRSIEQGWEYTVNDGETHYQTKLPCVLELPEGANHLTFYNVIPAGVTDGDVLRLQTQLGAYRVFVDGRLVDEFGQDATEKTYLFDCATAVLFGELTGADAGKELRIETSNLYPQYLAMQRAPMVGNHRDVLMSDMIDGTGGLLIILISVIFAVVFLLQYLFFLLKRQHDPVILLSAVFLLCLTLYYNTGNFFRLELWGYPKELFPVNDFIYYALQAFLPILGYIVVLTGTDRKLPRPLITLMCIHTVGGVMAVLLQMLWLMPYIYVEKPLILLTLVCYGWLTVCLHPWKLGSQNRWFITPVLLCIGAYLLDYYKSAGMWFPLPQEWAVWFQVDLPFMVFLPPMMLFYGVAVMLGIVLWQSGEKAKLTITVEQAETRFRLMETQYAYLDENQKQVRQLRHDMLHHVRIISGLLAEEQVEAAQKYLEHIGEMVTTPDLGQYCVSRTGNITINWFAREAAQLGIAFHCEADIPAERQECSADLCIVLANALQNALEASQTVADHPYIHITAAKQGHALLLHVENRFDGSLCYDEDGRIVSLKKEPGHGMGLTGIKQIAEKHSGYFKTSRESDIFHLETALNDLFSDV